MTTAARQLPPSRPQVSLLSLGLGVYFSILSLSCIMWIGALDNSSVPLSYL